MLPALIVKIGRFKKTCKMMPIRSARFKALQSAEKRLVEMDILEKTPRFDIFEESDFSLLMEQQNR